MTTRVEVKRPGIPKQLRQDLSWKIHFLGCKVGWTGKVSEDSGKTAAFNTTSHKLKINAGDFSKTSLTFYKTTRLRVPEDTN